MVWPQFSAVQFSSHQFVWKVRSVQFGEWWPSASVQFVQFSSVHSVQFTNSSGLTRIDLAGSVLLRFGSVDRVSDCLGGAEEQF